MATTACSRASTVPVGGKRCVAGGPNGVSCGNSQHTKGISIHHFPHKVKDWERHLLWVRFVRRHRPNWNPSDQTVLCGIHFDDASYTMRRDIALSLGIKVYLKPDAVPSIDVANFREEHDSVPLQAREKRQVRITSLLCSGLGLCLANLDYFQVFLLASRFDLLHTLAHKPQ